MGPLRDDTDLEMRTLDGLFRFRVAQTPQATAYYQFDESSGQWRSWRWIDVAAEVARWRDVLGKHRFRLGDRVAVMLPNCIEWVFFDQAALSLGLVTVPLFSGDNAKNCAHILDESDSRLVVVGTRAQFNKIESVFSRLPHVEQVVCVSVVESAGRYKWFETLQDWLPPRSASQSITPVDSRHGGDDLATIVYTSGTTGLPKGVMLTHANILTNVRATNQAAKMDSGDRFVSFLPLSHMFERTAGYYLPMLCGAEVAFARSPMTLADDLLKFKPTVLVSVPRIYEQVLARIRGKLQSSPVRRALFRLSVFVGRYRANWLCGLAWPVVDRLMASRVRAVFGGRVRYAISGGAPIPPAVARVFLALGLPIYQGYGLTETSPVVSVNLPGDNVPESIGPPLPGVEVRFDDNDELLIRSEYVMQGYWKRPEETDKAIDADGWFHTGDKAWRDASGRLYITGRIKEIIVMSNGEKVPPADIEQALLDNPLISQVMVHGEGHPFLIALVVASDAAASVDEIKRSSTKLLRSFPAYARVRRFILFAEPWSVDNEMLTPTLKLRRAMIVAHHKRQIEEAYRGI